MLEFGGENLEINEKSRLAPFLLSLSDDQDLTLRVVIAFPKDGKAGTDPGSINEKVKDLLDKSVPVGADMDQVYEIVFENYILYQMRNESYTSWDEYEIRKGRYLIVFERSRLLDYYEDAIFDFDSEETRKTQRKHYGIYTENHILDIISNEPPKIRRIGADK
jgi:hypothetical protein